MKIFNEFGVDGLHRSDGGSLTQQLLNRMGAAIANNLYQQGSSALKEADICEAFDVSRSATREVVKMLAAKGMLMSRPRQGIMIQPKTQWNMFDKDILRWILEGSPSLQVLSEFMQLRLAIEPEAAALAAMANDQDQIGLLKQALDRMKRAEQGLEDSLEADIRFHTQLLQATCNPFFMQFSGFIDSALPVSIRFTNRVKGVSSASFEDHENIYKAIALGDPKEARYRSQSVQEEALKLIKKALEEDRETTF